jgi:uncharacterized membrane protein YphA (DoxX/SURF4 family)
MISSGSLDEVVGLLSQQFAAFAALLLLAAGGHKLLRRQRARSVITEFAGVAYPLAGVVAAVVAAAEISAGLLICVPEVRGVGAIMAAVIWIIYLVYIVRAIARGRRDLDCGCSFGGGHAPLGLFQIVRNIILAAGAVLVAVVSLGHADPITVSQGLAALALFALYGALDQVMALQPPRAGELS